jgi:hypothetical protein
VTTSGTMGGRNPIVEQDVRIVPANEASWHDLAAIFGTADYPARCQPAGWVAVEPRTAYPKLRTSRVPWSGRDEDKDDDGVWQVFQDAGFKQVSRPTPRRAVMRIDFDFDFEQE